jgi:hypothetical protein
MVQNRITREAPDVAGKFMELVYAVFREINPETVVSWVKVSS